MRKQINNVISVCYSAIRLGFLKLFYGSNLKSGIVERISPNVVIEIEKGKLILGNMTSIHSNCKLKVRKNAQLEFGERVFLNYGCMITCREYIKIGSGSMLGPNVLIYDHDHDFHLEGELRQKRFKNAPVSIGKNCWIGANTVILKGVTIGDEAVIGAGCVVTRDVPAKTIMIQKRERIERLIQVL